jgi:hypothetical protein
MSDPNDPVPADQAGTGSTDQPTTPEPSTGRPEVLAAGSTSADERKDTSTADEVTAPVSAAAAPEGGETKAAGSIGKGRTGKKRANPPSRPWMTIGGAAAALALLTGFGYFGGMGPLSRLSTTRDIHPPAELAGLDRVTDPEIRDKLKVDKTREDLMRINEGKQATVEAYDDPAGKRMFVVVALRGRVDIDQAIKDGGSTPDQVKQVGKSTCVEAHDTMPTMCYRGSGMFTTIVSSATEGVAVDAVGPVADAAYEAMK